MAGKYKRVDSSLKCPGGKYYIARKIVSLFPPRDTYLTFVEPYAFSAAVMLAHDPAEHSEILNDLNYSVTNFFRVLQADDLFSLFLRRVGSMPWSKPEFEKALGRLQDKADDEISVERAVDFFIVNRMSRSGNGKGMAPFTVNRLRRGMLEQVSAFLGTIDGLEVLHDRLIRVGIEHGKAVPLIKRLDAKTTLYYVDCPYPVETRSCDDHYGEFEMTAADHEELLDTVKSCKGKFVISSYDNALYNEALRSWTRHEIDQPLHSSGKKTKERKTELLFMNY